jgi:glycosyltransferase involved in cell wall biosynthesis
MYAKAIVDNGRSSHKTILVDVLFTEKFKIEIHLDNSCYILDFSESIVYYSLDVECKFVYLNVIISEMIYSLYNFNSIIIHNLMLFEIKKDWDFSWLLTEESNEEYIVINSVLQGIKICNGEFLIKIKDFFANNSYNINLDKIRFYLTNENLLRDNSQNQILSPKNSALYTSNDGNISELELIDMSGFIAYRGFRQSNNDVSKLRKLNFLTGTDFDQIIKRKRDIEIELSNRNFVMEVSDFERELLYLYLISDGVSKNQENLKEWLSSRCDEMPQLNNLLFHAYNYRKDLKDKFNPNSINFNVELNNWLINHGRKELGFNIILDFYTPEIIPFLEPKKVGGGFNIVGNVNTVQGLSIHTELVLKSLNERRISHTYWGSPVSLSKKNTNVIDSDTSRKLFEKTLYIVNGNHVESMKTRIPKEIIDKTFGIIWCTWELSDISEHYADGLRNMQEIWAVSDFVKQAVEKKLNKEVYRCNIPLTSVNITDSADKYPHNFERYIFYSFDYLSGFDRKNCLSVIKVYENSDAQKAGVKLIIKVINSYSDILNHEVLLESILFNKNILVIEEELSRNQTLNLISNSFCVLSLHRSEGFGLLLAEALLLDVPVIATGYSGNLDFMDESNSLLVEYDLIELSENNPSEYLSLDARWADPKISDAIDKLNALIHDAQLYLFLKQNARQNYLRLIDFKRFIHETNVSKGPFVEIRSKIQKFLPNL